MVEVLIGPPRTPTHDYSEMSTHPFDTVKAGLGLRLRSSRSGIPRGADLEAGIGVSCVVSVTSAFVASTESPLLAASC